MKKKSKSLFNNKKITNYIILCFIDFIFIKLNNICFIFIKLVYLKIYYYLFFLIKKTLIL